MANIDVLIKTCVELGATKAIENLGLSSGEISRSRAVEVYGKYFKEAVKKGRLHPVRVGDGKNGKILYRVEDILALKAIDAIRAEIK